MIIKNISKLRKIISSMSNKIIYYVPTMGNLHEGHLKLIKYAQEKDQFVVVSIYVNPLQFDSMMDYKRYPRTIKRDLKILEKLNVDIIFLPENNFSKDNLSKLSLGKITHKLCGLDRPGHFSGVATIILKFLNIIQPDFLILGKKDYQQILVIKQIIKDFFLKIKVLERPTVRDRNGLALSSRNMLIPRTKKNAAENIFRVLKSISREIRMTGLEKKKLESYKKIIVDSGIDKVNYLEILNENNLDEIGNNPTNARIFISVSISGIKLIDNLKVSKRINLRSGKFISC